MTTPCRSRCAVLILALSLGVGVGAVADGSTSGELVLVRSRSPSAVSALELHVPPTAQLLARNHHAGSLLLRLEAGEELVFPPGLAAKVARDVARYPTRIPDAVRVLASVTGTQPPEDGTKDQLFAEVEARGGVAVWRSRFTNVVQFDLPLDALSFLEETDLLADYFFNTHLSPALGQSVPLIGGPYYDPFYWGPSWDPWDPYYIAVIDTGVLSGGALSGRVDHALGACFSAAGVPPATGPGDNFESLCPGGADEAYGVGSATPCDDSPECPHGSVVSAVAVSAGSPTGVVAAPQVKIMPIKAVMRDRRNPDNLNDDRVRMFEGDLQRALEYVLQAGLVGIRVGAVNISYQLSDNKFSTPQAYSEVCSGALAPFFDQLDVLGIASVAAAGNIFGPTPSYGWDPQLYGGVDNPACYASVIAVGATKDTTDAVAVNLPVSGVYFSTQSGPLIDFWAPGAPIQTPVDPTVHYYGTSFSAPHVAAIWTRLKARYPSLTNAQLRAKLQTCPWRTDPRNGKSAPRICWNSIWN